jgi:hypothetical protein
METLVLGIMPDAALGSELLRDSGTRRPFGI